MQLVYLDTNIWNLLVDNPTHPLNVDLLKRAYRAGVIQVVGSLALEEEIVGVGHRDTPKFKRMLHTYRHLVSTRSLIPLNERHVAEIAHGGNLPSADRYNTPARQRAVRAHLGNGSELIATADAIHVAKQDDYARQIASREQVRLAMKAEGIEPGREIDDWFRSSDVDDWVRDIVAEGERRGLASWNDSEPTTFARLPSAWLLTAYSMVRIKRVVGDHRKVQPSDRHDAEHCAAGGYFDVFVTSDAEFTRSLHLIRGLPFLVMDPLSFATTTRNALERTPPAGPLQM